MKYDKEWDVIVVGGGPAGNHTAQEFAKRGMKTLVIDRKQQIGPPKRCGEGLSMRWVEIAGLKPNSRWALQRITGVTLIAPNGKKVDIDMGKSKRTGYIIERSQWEKMEAEKAIRAGAKYMLKTIVTGLIMEEKVVKGVKIMRDGKEEEYYAKIVAACDGVDSMIGRYAGLRTAMPLTECDAGYQYEMVNVPIDNPEFMELYFGNEIAPRGYCVVEGTEVIANGIRAEKIENMEIGDKVLTAEGYSPVVATFSRNYQGKVVKIKPFMFNQELKVTPEHQVYAWNKKNGFVWKRADSLKKSIRGSHRDGDYLVFPAVKDERINKIRVTDYVDGIVEKGRIYSTGRNQFGAEFIHPKSRKSGGLPIELPITGDFMELCGFYVSEGCIKGSGIILSNTDEKIIKRVKELAYNCGFKTTQWKSRNQRGRECISVEIFPKLLGQLFKKLFGHGARNKRVPRFVLGLGDELKWRFINGLYLGDGCLRKPKRNDQGPRICYTSASKDLIRGLWILLSTMGIVGAISQIKPKKAWQLRVCGHQATKFQMFGAFDEKVCAQEEYRGFMTEDDGTVLLGIKSLEEEDYDGKVYDIQANGSFCAPFVIHNCWVFPKGKDVANVGIGITGQDAETAKKYLDAWIEANNERFKDSSITEINAGVIPVTKPVDEFVADGLMLIGDSARMVNPIHGGGMGSALEAAIMAAEVGTDAIKKDDVSKKELKKYQDMWEKKRGEEFKKILRVRHFVEKLNDEQVNIIEELVEKAEIDPKLFVDLSHGEGLGKLAKALIKTSPSAAKFAMSFLK